MKFLKNIQTLEELKKEYKRLARIHHPDMGGETKDMQQLNNEFETLFTVFKVSNRVSNSEVTTNEESATEFQHRFYTANGWEGSRYDGNLDNKTIAKKVREFVKCVYPNCKFSITSSYLDIHVYLMEAPFEAFKDPETKEAQINHYYIERDNRLTEKTSVMLQTICEYLNSYNYDDSDSMTDYFDTNFYIHLAVGKWDKPFKKVVATARIQDKTPKTKQRTTEENNTDIVTEKNGYTYDIKEDTDTRDNSKIFIVKVLENLTREEYLKVSKYMKSIGGYYSKFKHGFLFRVYPEALTN